MSTTDLAKFIDRYTIEYVRTYPHPIERVFRAVTDPAEVSVWFSPMTIDPRVGGAYSFDPYDPHFSGVIIAVEPPRRVRYGGPNSHGPEGYWEFLLEPVAGGTRMTFVQHSQPGHFHRPEWPLDPPDSAPDTPWRPGTLSGWHSAFDGLADVLNGVAVGSRPYERGAALTQAYREHMRATMP